MAEQYLDPLPLAGPPQRSNGFGAVKLTDMVTFSLEQVAAAVTKQSTAGEGCGRVTLGRIWRTGCAR